MNYFYINTSNLDQIEHNFLLSDNISIIEEKEYNRYDKIKILSFTISTSLSSYVVFFVLIG